MTVQPQPEALRLANRLDADATDADMGRKPVMSTRRKAAAELRRLHARIAELEERSSKDYWLLYAMKEQELCYQDELVEEAKLTAAEKLRADQMTEQHRMQSAMNAEARSALAMIELNGPQVTRGERADGTPVMSTMRQAWFDAQQAAQTEAQRGDELAAQLREKRQPLSDEQIADIDRFVRGTIFGRFAQAKAFTRRIERIQGIGDPT